MSNQHWFKPASIFMLLFACLPSSCGLFSFLYSSAATVLFAGFPVSALYIVVALACLIFRRYKDSVILGSGAAIATFATWMMVCFIDRDALVPWFGKPLILIVMGTVFVCGLLGAIASFIIIQRFERKSI